MRFSLNSMRLNRIRGQYLLPVMLACTLIALSRPILALDDPVTPMQLVEQFHGKLLAVMKDAKRLGYRGRLAALTPEIARAFHLPVMTRINTRDSSCLAVHSRPPPVISSGGFRTKLALPMNR